MQICYMEIDKEQKNVPPSHALVKLDQNHKIEIRVG